MADSFGDVQQSFQRCLTRKDFLARFYDIFMASHPAVSDLFKNTDLDKQISLLRHGLSASIAYAGGTKLGTSVMNRIGETHGRKKMNVDPSLYPYWISSLVQAVSETDPKYTPMLGERWRSALHLATSHIRSMH